MSPVVQASHVGPTHARSHHYEAYKVEIAGIGVGDLLSLYDARAVAQFIDRNRAEIVRLLSAE